MKLQKNEFCNRILKCKLKKCMAPMVSYYELVYNFWRKELEINRKRRQRYAQPAPQQMLSYVRTGRDLNPSVHSGSRRPSQRKSNSVESSETNATWNEKASQGGRLFKEGGSLTDRSAEDHQDELRGQSEMTPYHFQKRMEPVYPKLQRKPAEKKSVKKTECLFEKPHKKFERQKNQSFSSIEQAVRQRMA